MPIWPKNKPSIKKYWCASFTVAALHKIGILKYYRINTLDIDDIIEILEKSNRKIISSTPLQLQQIINRNFIDSIV